MQYLLDTVTIIRHFSEIGKIGKKAQEILDSAYNTFVISVVSLMEILYLSEKRRIKIDLIDTLNRIELSSLYQIADLTPDILRVANDLHFPELHDRLILSTAKWLDIPIISSDEKFKNVEGIKAFWD
ncbi:MAG: PIN domain-containing protein [candidate division KSB1 bacterium]|nr:PIN domain-containing protein [candidate division KSB1 bacterium]